jgi:hypothetical protein
MLKINVEIEKLATTYSSRYMTELAEAYLLWLVPGRFSV